VSRARVASGIAGAAVGVAVVTVVARAVGFGRWIVFSKTVEGGCLADVYNTANLLPNVLFEVVAGGALAAVVVPVLAGAVERGDRAHASRTVSALLTWSLLLLVPVALAAAVLAGPLVRFFLGAATDCPPGSADAGTRMLLLFLPQLFCYAVAVVLSGALQAHRRFLAAALAPLVSSCVVIGAYLTFAALADGRLEVDAVPRSAETALALGTTLGVAALALCGCDRPCSSRPAWPRRSARSPPPASPCCSPSRRRCSSSRGWPTTRVSPAR
jgi:putative peptidoglycan lipid II flippase